jgi:hypothetical protein
VGVVENMKDVADLIRKFGDIDLNRKILALETEVLDLTREKRRAEQKAEELEEKLKIRDELVFREDQYYRKRGDAEEGPFCSLCWDRGGNLVRKTFNHLYGISCPACVIDRITVKRK